MLVKRIEAETKQEAKRQARLEEHIEIKKDYRYYEIDTLLIEDRTRQGQRENWGASERGRK